MGFFLVLIKYRFPDETILPFTMSADSPANQNTPRDAIDAVATPLPGPAPLDEQQPEVTHQDGITEQEEAPEHDPPGTQETPLPQGAPPLSQSQQAPPPEGYDTAPNPGYAPGPRQSYREPPGGQQIPLTINQLAIVASAQNKLPVSNVKSIVCRVGRHTESSMQKSGGWYKNDHSYVDKDSYSWKNMPLFEEYQRHLWTREGTVRDSFKK